MGFPNKYVNINFYTIDIPQEEQSGQLADSESDADSEASFDILPKVEKVWNLILIYYSWTLLTQKERASSSSITVRDSDSDDDFEILEVSDAEVYHNYICKL